MKTEYTKEEIALILHTTELLKQKGASQKINISAVCKDANISRKNAYKHKKNINRSERSYQDKLARLEQEHLRILEKLKLAETRALEADLHSDCREFLKQYVKDNKKNPERQKKLIDDYNELADLHGLEPLDF